MIFGKKKQYAYRRKLMSHLNFKYFRVNMFYALILNSKNVKLSEKLEKTK